jgi:hypothetical protein
MQAKPSNARTSMAAYELGVRPGRAALSARDDHETVSRSEFSDVLLRRRPGITQPAADR